MRRNKTLSQKNVSLNRFLYAKLEGRDNGFGEAPPLAGNAFALDEIQTLPEALVQLA